MILQDLYDAAALFDNFSDSTCTFLYTDEDGDLVTFSTQDELDEACRVLRTSTSAVSTFTFQIKIAATTGGASASTHSASEFAPLLHQSVEEQSLSPEELRLHSATADASTPTSVPAHVPTPPAVHTDVVCDECGMNPILGTRYKCVVRDDFDLCAECEANKTQPYASIKMTEPVPPIEQHFGRRRDAHPHAQQGRDRGHRANGHGSGGLWRRETAENSLHTHAGVECDGCGMNPIVGTRFKCIVRDNYDLCANCEANKTQSYASIKMTEPAPPLQTHRQGGGRGGGLGKFLRGGKWLRAIFGGNSFPNSTHSTQSGGNQGGCPGHRGNGVGRGGRSNGPFMHSVPAQRPSVHANVNAVFEGIAQQARAEANRLGESNEGDAFRPWLSAAASIADIVATATATATASTTGDGGDRDVDDAIAADVMRESLQGSTANASAGGSAGGSASFASTISASGDREQESDAEDVAMNVAYRPKCRYVRDLTYPDGTEVPPSTQFFKTWRVRNDGEEAWAIGSAMQYSSGDDLEHIVNDLPLAKAGEEVDVSVAIISPAAEGRYTIYFRLSAPDGKLFGQRFWCDVRVVSTAVESNSDSV